MTNNFMDGANLLEAVQKIEQERQILLETINNNNEQIQSMKELEDELYMTELSQENLQDALFVILYNLKALEGKTLEDCDITELLSKITTVSYKGLLNTPVKQLYKKEVLKGGIVFQQTLENFPDDTNDDKEGYINISFYKKE